MIRSKRESSPAPALRQSTYRARSPLGDGAHIALIRHLKVRMLAVAFVSAALAACSDSPAGPSGNTLTTIAGQGQTGVAGSLLPSKPTVTVRDASGAFATSVPVTFTIVSGAGAVSDTTVLTNAAGIASTSWYLGPVAGVTNTVRATAGNVSVEFTAGSTDGVEGQSYFGDRSFIEYVPGTLPIVISVPHDGTLDAADIPPRTFGVVSGRDTNTDPLGRAISDAFFAATGKRPHMIYCRLRRSKLDANREIVEAAQGSRVAERYWYEYHAFIRAAQTAVARDYPRGFYMDLHAHGHAIARLELGYLLTSTELQLPASQLNSAAIVNETSIRTLVQSSGSTLSQLLTGPLSLGTLFEERGWPAVPSASQPHPGTAPYFNGGYNTATWGSRTGGNISGFQLETHNTGVRNNAESRALFAAGLVEIFDIYLKTHMGLDITP